MKLVWVVANWYIAPVSKNEEIKPTLPEISAEDEAMIRGLIPGWHEEVRQYLPGLPDELKVRLDNTRERIIPEMGVGGTAFSASEIELSFNPAFKNRQAQLVDLKGTYFHEAYHVVRGFTLDSTDLPLPIDRAIEEGLAEVFERKVPGSQTIVGDYSDNDDIDKWVLEIMNVSPSEFGKNWRKYIINDLETNRRWIIYSVGKYIVDRALENNKEVNIVDLASYSCSEILELAALDEV